MYWMQARNIPHYDAPFQKVGLYSSDNLMMVDDPPKVYPGLFVRLSLVRSLPNDYYSSVKLTRTGGSISTAPRILGLKRFGKGPTGLAMLVSISGLHFRHLYSSFNVSTVELGPFYLFL